MKQLIKGFGYAFQGLYYLVKTERNFQIHTVALILVIILGIILSISSVEWMFLLLTSAMVLCLEAVNSSIEELSNEVDENSNIRIGRVKDIAASAVLIASIFSIVIAGFIFLPYLF